MKLRFSASIIVLAMCFAFPAFSGDYAKGFEAFQRGKYDIALIEFRELAKQENVNAQFNLGLMYEHGLGVSNDTAIAAEWYTLAALQGKAEAQLRLGVLFESGIDTKQDFESAVKWYRRAAEQGLAEAESRLGKAFQLGQGVIQDDVLAEKWLLRAANKDVTAAQIMLGELLFAIGFPPNTNSNAYMWMSIAASSGDKYAKKKIRFFSIFMTPNQIVVGETTARDWKAKLEKR